MNTFDYRGYRISFSQFGDENERKVVIVPDDGKAGTSAAELILYLKSAYRLILIDFLGCGQSDKPPGFVSDLAGDQAGQLKELFYHLNLEKAALVGLGEGGCRTCEAFLREAPERVDLAVFTAKSFRPCSLPPEAAGKFFSIPDSMRPADGLSWMALGQMIIQILEDDLPLCPYCGQPMARGVISGMARWTMGMDGETGPAEGCCDFYLQNYCPKGFINCLKFTFDRNTSVLTAYLCFTCGKLTADVSHLLPQNDR